MDKVSLNGVEIFPFDSEQQLLHYVDTHKGILVAINAEKILHPRNRHVPLSIEILGIVMEPVHKWL